MPREIVTIQVGQCGLQLGSKFWDLALREHAAINQSANTTTQQNIYTESMATFFRNVDNNNNDIIGINKQNSLQWQSVPIYNLRARAVLVDMECGVLNSIQSTQNMIGELFDQKSMVSDVSGSGNNFAHGHYHYGNQYKDSILESIRYTVEQCDSIQSFFLMHSLGGGTGSGLGTRITQLIHDAYPDVMRFSTVVFPSVDDDVVTSPYNSILAINQLIEHSDCVLPIDNQALIDIVNRIEQPTQAQLVKSNLKNITNINNIHQQKVTLLDINDNKKSKRRAYDNMNIIGSHLLTHLTSGMRFGGELNVDLNEISMTLVPYPSLHFLLPALAPLAVNTNLSHTDGMKSIDSMCTDIIKSDSQLIQCEPRTGYYLSCMLLGRGAITVSDLQRNINYKLKQSTQFVHWNDMGYKVGVCGIPTIGYKYSILSLSNNTCIRDIFDRLSSKCAMMYRVRAHLHHYQEYMDQQIMSDSLNNVLNLIDSYDEINVQQNSRLTN